MAKGAARTFGQDLMRGEHTVGGGKLSALVDPKSVRAGTFQGGAPDTVRDAGFYARKRSAEEQAGRALSVDEFRALEPAGDEETASGTSIFDPVLTELAYRWFCPPGGVILDPFAGGSVRGIVAAVLGYQYTGVELRPEQVAANRAQAAAICPDAPPVWLTGDSAAVLPGCGVAADFAFSCPPYGDLEIYSDFAEDLSAMPHAAFLESYREIIALTCAQLKPDRFAAFVVGDFRCKKGFYRNFVGETVAAFEAAGARYYNEAILVTAVGSLPIRVGKQFAAGRKLGKTHQNMLVFCNGDPKKAVAAFSA